jgi:probable selenium-dependent hydroxylase accessory protein YqeC
MNKKLSDKKSQSIEKIFCAEPDGVISFVGGGGKTSLMFHLANLLVLAGERVLTTTTTNIFVPSPEQSTTLLVDENPETLLQLVASCRRCTSHVTAASVYQSEIGKLKGFDPEHIMAFEKSGLFDWILVEADGAAGRPLKAPAEHEPVIPSNTSVIVAVAGLDVLGKPLSDDFVFRSALAEKLMGLKKGEAVTESALACFFARPATLFKGAPAGLRRLIFLNKADDYKSRGAGRRIAAQLRYSNPAVAETLIVGQALEKITFHSVHSLVQGE